MSEMASTTASMLNLDRPKPHNEEAEIAVLGAMLFSTEAVSSAIGALKLENAFYRPAHQTIFNAMVELTAGKSEVALDPLVVSDHLERNGKLEEVGGRAYIAQLMDSVPTAANIDYYVEIVKQNAILRHIIATCTETIQQCYGAEDGVHTLLDGIEQKIFEVTGMNETKDLQSVQPLVREAVDYLEKLINGNPDILGLRTGFDIDKMITGLKPGEMFVLAARPSIGKTALALNMAANIAMNPSHPAAVGIFSLEMPALSLILRMICSESRVGLAEFRNKTINQSRWTDVMRAANNLNKAKIVIDDTGAIDILELRAKARRMKAKHNVEAIFV
ncbi:MAG: replicative DNA helicase, partial [Victivallales bacterium]|nr:replicative DNA helicase [Victivallales bacterium]